MKKVDTASASPASENSGAVPESLKTVISLLLFIHLFAMSVGLIANSATIPSQLTQVIRGTLLQYLYLTWTDVGFGYSYVGSELDMQHKVYGDILLADGSTITVEAEPENTSGLRHDRYVRLKRNLVARLDNPELEGQIPAMIGGGLLRQTEGSPVNVVIRAELISPVDYYDFREGSTAQAPPAVLYRARVGLLDGEPRIVEKFSNRGQVAPNRETPPVSSSTNTTPNSTLAPALPNASPN